MPRPRTQAELPFEGRPITPPHLLVELEPWERVFARNLADLFRPAPPQLAVSSLPGSFWPDVFVHRPLPARWMGMSALYHVTLLIIACALPSLYLLAGPLLHPATPKPETTVTYYDVSEYLPPINASSRPAKVAKKGEPARAAQPIISVPQNPDNFEQTIVNPYTVQVARQHANLPNLVVWTPVPAPAPVASARRSIARLTLPTLAPEIIRPRPEQASRKTSDIKLPSTEASVIQPMQNNTPRKIGEINLARVDAAVSEPKLPVAEQQTPIEVKQGSGKAREENVAPPSLTMDSGGAGSEAMGKMIALGLHPSAPSGPITVPGNRSGQFAATPSGDPNAPGTPDVYAGGEGPGGSKSGTGNSGGPGSGNGPGGPTGIYVGAGPVNPGAGVQGDKPTSNGAGGGSGQERGTAAPRKEVATVAPPRLPQPRETRPVEAPEIEDRVFSGKKYYSLTINMPNLTSAGGSWIMRFAELNQTRQAGELTAPVAMNKVDPAYPPDLMKDRVEGTVTLYAVIHSDGTVSEIRVLRSLDDRLDENAARALSRWHFRPATKNGQAVDLEAVVVIPFKVKARPY